MTPQHAVKATIRRGEDYYVAECLGIAVVTQGKTLDETVDNLREAVSLHLDGVDPADFGLVQDPWILLTFELELAGAQT